MFNVFLYTSNASYGGETTRAAIEAAPIISGEKIQIILVSNNGSMNELLIGFDVGYPYYSYIKISYYTGVTFYKHDLQGWKVTNICP